jgi:site-specific recombinase XerC
VIEEVQDFAQHCRVERRLAPLTCQAYERDVGACHEFMQGAGFGSWAQVRLVDLRRFLAAEAERRPAPSSQARTVGRARGFAIRPPTQGSSPSTSATPTCQPCTATRTWPAMSSTPQPRR